MEDQTQQTQSDELYVLTDEQIAAIADGAAQGAAASVSDDVTGAVARSYDDLSGQIRSLGSEIEGAASSAGTVQLTDEQFDQLTALMSSQLHGSLYLFAVLMFIAGLVGISQVVNHWKAGR